MVFHIYHKAQPCGKYAKYGWVRNCESFLCGIDSCFTLHTGTRYGLVPAIEYFDKNRMAHSFIYAKNQNTERSVALPDSLLHIFIYFFNVVLEQQGSLSGKRKRIYRHYVIELVEVHTSYIDLLLEEISNNTQLKRWYLSILSQLKLKLYDFGEDINHEYLNQVPELLIGYPPNTEVFTKPVPVLMLENLINDICWVLNEDKYVQSDQYKWFEENI